MPAYCQCCSVIMIIEEMFSMQQQQQQLNFVEELVVLSLLTVSTTYMGTAHGQCVMFM